MADTTSASVPLRDYFDDLYRMDDPYGTAERWFKRRKRQLLLASLPREHFGAAFEPACGRGELTYELASRCDQIFACDFCAAAVEQTQRRTHTCSNVTLAVRCVPQFWAGRQASSIWW